MLMKWSPYFEVLRNDGLWGDQRAANVWRPPVDVVEKDDAFWLEAEIPGVDPEDVEVYVQGRVLTVRAERKRASDDIREGYRRIERFHGSFQRSFTIPESVDADKVDASVTHGVLRIALPKTEASLPRRIRVRVGGLADKAKKLFSRPKSEKQQAA